MKVTISTCCAHAVEEADVVGARDVTCVECGTTWWFGTGPDTVAQLVSPSKFVWSRAERGRASAPVDQEQLPDVNEKIAKVSELVDADERALADRKRELKELLDKRALVKARLDS